MFIYEESAYQNLTEVVSTGMGKVHREDWPRVREVVINGEDFYRMDGRRTGTNGKQETFKELKDALKRAAELADDVETAGREAHSFPAELRGMALAGEKLLKPYGKTIFQAAEFYKAHLDEVHRKEQSALVPTIAGKWLAEKKSGKSKKLRGQTLKGIEQASKTLSTVFAGKRMLEVTTADIRKHLDGLKVGLRRKFNINSRFSQFFNWSIKHGHTTFNPCDSVEIHVGGKDVSILKPREVLALMKACEDKHKDLLLYHAISLFAGLRPEECLALEWENVHFDEAAITVLAKTSKTNETRTVPIGATLLAWLVEYKPEKPVGYVTEQSNFKKRSLSLHVHLGYRGMEKNKHAPEWPQDVLRHSYGSYWLAKHKNRAQLAENMGNSVQIIKKHYKQVVSNSAVKEYWKIVPGYGGEGVVKELPSRDDLKKIRGKRLADALSRDEESEKS